ncbi:MAG: hypothetical protein Q7T03_06260 [Deltaproteobacteria bacterium]|nr:hypothetical protein [Deltaproteobacteria bacterium]
METEEIEKLFDRLSQQHGIASEASKQIFTLLIHVTLKYRDTLVEMGEKALTVEETREALDELVYMMKENTFSKNVPDRIQNLVTLWNEEIKHQIYN